MSPPAPSAKPDAPALPAYLRVHLALLGLRPRDLARLAGLSEAYLSLVLAGQRVPPRRTAQRLVDALAAYALDAFDAGRRAA